MNQIEKLLSNSSYKVLRVRRFEQIFKFTLAGIYISFGCVFMSIIKSDNILSPACSNLLSGLVFSIGLILVTTCCGELFTGNCTIISLKFEPDDSNVIRPAKGVITQYLIYNYVFNFIGAFLIFAIIKAMNFNIPTIENIAIAKFSKDPLTLFLSGLMCNLLVCLVVIANTNSKSTSDKILLTIFPVGMFVACGFEHSVADMFFAFFTNSATISPFQVFLNLMYITLGNIAGGMLITTFAYKSSRWS